MILADTSIWINHFRKGDADLSDRLTSMQILVHPIILGELACGNLPKRRMTLSDLQGLPQAIPATDAEVLMLIHERKIWARGIGWMDAHLLASSLLTHCRLWTRDASLRRVADEFGVSFSLPRPRELA